MHRALKTLLAALTLLGAGCMASTAGGPHGKVGSGSINQPQSETITLSTGTIQTHAWYAGTIDQVGWQFRILSGTAVCSVPVLQYSIDFNPAVDSPSDETKWDSVTLDTNPPSIVSGANKFGVQYVGFAWTYFRWEIVCSSGTSTLTLTTEIKGS